MMRVALFTLLLLAGCVSPLQRDVEEATLKAKIAEVKAQTQNTVMEACEARRSHSGQCHLHCRYGVEYYRTRDRARKPSGKPVGEAPLSIFHKKKKK